MSQRRPLVGYEKAAAVAIAQAKLAINYFAERLQLAFTSAAGFIEHLGRELVRLAAILEPVQDAREGRALLARHRRRRC